MMAQMTSFINYKRIEKFMLTISFSHVFTIIQKSKIRILNLEFRILKKKLDYDKNAKRAGKSVRIEGAGPEVIKHFHAQLS